MSKYTLLLLLFLVSPVSAGEWSSTDTSIEAAWQTINIIDWGQTLDIADKCRNSPIHERNPLLRRCPSFSDVNKHFVLGSLLHYGVSYSLPGKYRAAFQWVTIGYSVHIIDSNVQLGLDMKF